MRDLLIRPEGFHCSEMSINGYCRNNFWADGSSLAFSTVPLLGSCHRCLSRERACPPKPQPHTH